MDPDTFEMSPEKRAFTVERVDMTANALGCHSPLSQIQDRVSLSFSPLSPSFNSIFFAWLYLAYSPWMCAISLFVCVRVLLADIGFWELFSPHFSPLSSDLLSPHTDVNSHAHLRVGFNNRLLQTPANLSHTHTQQSPTHTRLSIRPILDPHTGFFWVCSRS